MSSRSILPILFALAAVSSASAGQCTGGNFRCSYFTKDQCGAEWDAWCSANDNPLPFESECEGTVFCHDLTEAQCNKAPAQDEYGGCTYLNESNAVASATLALTSVAVALLLGAVFLLVKMTRAQKASVGDGAEGTTSEPLLGGADA